jgi:hypothetical protein
MRRDRIMEGLHGIVAEHEAARRAITFLLERAADDPSLLRPEDPTFADLRACLRNLERTYIVRLFALFEETLRGVWNDAFGRATTPGAMDLLNGCAATRAISPATLLSDAHEVREYRNFVIHGTPAPVVALADSKRRLCRFLAWMPESW